MSFVLFSGLPDFRGNKGFWRAYPPLERLGLRLPQMSNPEWFDRDPKFAWGFFAHRYNLYSTTEPHEGFKMLLDWGKRKEHGYFVFTSNVDGHFQKAGFDDDRVVECHGSINFLQTADDRVCEEIWPVPENTIYDVDMDKIHLQGELPKGPPNNPVHLARPNILMFGDWKWVGDRTNAQEQRLDNFLASLSKSSSCSNKEQSDSLDVVVVEIGAGLAVPTVRFFSERVSSSDSYNGVLVRINPNEEEVPRPGKDVSLKMKGLFALKEIEKHLT